VFGEPRPGRLSAFPLRPLKAWRYVGVFDAELMLCLASVRIGPARQSFWAVWDRGARRLYERTRRGPGAVRLTPGRAQISDGAVSIDLELDETAGIETVCPSGSAYGWTRKQGGIHARGTVKLGGRRIRFDARAVIDDTAAYYKRHTIWRWSAGIGRAEDGRELAWNLVQGVNDPVRDSERTIWIDGVATEPPPVRFDPALTCIGALRFQSEATRQRKENLLLVRSAYRQPFGSFSGDLPGGVSLAAGYGVMEEHDVWW
jgi:hypothetical protein